MRLALLVTSLSTLLLVGYQIRHEHPVEQVSTPEVAAPLAAVSDLEAGDRVVGRWQTAFYEGTVIEADGKLIVVAWDSGTPDHSHLPRSWVTRAEVFVTEPSAGRWYVAHLDGQWQLVRAADGGFETLDGSTRGIEGRAMVVKLPTGLTDWAERHGGQTITLAKRKKTMSGLAPATLGAPLAKGDPVFARWSDGNWWRATVKSIKDGRITVTWEDSGGEMVLDATSVALVKPGSLEKGSFAICEWYGSTRWWRAVINDVHDGVYSVYYIDGTIADVEPSNCVAAVPSQWSSVW